MPPKSNKTRKRSRIDESAAFSGFVLGLLVGGLLALFRGPRFDLRALRPPSGETLRSAAEALKPRDTLKQSIEEAKQAARHRARR
ncbi:MAG: hypothetical protein EA396_13950 [Anaerolineaceae bacterium]|nr:MAG: hypothetical protein EA396_13950 [Anaerolineaceae bacterium]